MHWDSWINAEIYDRFVRDRKVYAWLNRRLVELVDVSRAQSILDLACGTGATTMACLRAMPAGAEVVAIDASEAMVRIARSSIVDPRARFETMPASEAHRLEETFDRVVCCAAFWQFPSARAVFRALSARVTPGALLAFNVPAERVQGESAPVHPVQAALVGEIEQETGRRFLAQPVLVDDDRLKTDAAELGFALERRERFVYHGLQGELLDLMTIPAMIGPLTEGLDDDARDRIGRRMQRRTDPDLAVEVPWVYYLWRFEGSAA